MPRQHRRSATARLLWPAALCAALCSSQVVGDAALEFSVAELTGDGWRATGVAISLQRNDAGRLTVAVSAQRLELPAPIGELGGDCLDLVVTVRRFTCRAVRLRPGPGLASLPQLSGNLEYRRDSGAISWDLRVASPGALSFGGTLADDDWSVRLTATDWPLEQLAPWADLLGHALPGLGGHLDLSVVARGAAGALHGAVFEARGAAVDSANETGTVAAEGLGFELRGSAWREDGALAFDARGTVSAGEAYIEPIYASLAAHPLRWTARGSASGERITLGQLVMQQDGIIHADGRAELAPAADGGWDILSGRLRIAEAELPGAYTLLLKPFLAGTPLGNLDSSGLLRGEVTITDNALEEIWLELATVDLDDRDARLAIYGLSGDLAWGSARDGTMTARARPANLRWSGGFVYGIPFGAARIRMDAYGGRWSLPFPVSIPVLDGALEIEALEIGDFMAGDDTILFDAHLTPLSMRELSRALDWPPLSGHLSGTLPSLSYEDGVLTVGGDLSAELFRGTIAIRELRIERPLQPLARLRAEVEFRGLELAELTEALSFGLMTGRLDGYVRGLEMIDWAPVAFDARVYTPPASRARQRISQRAVDNIASIGGGGAGMLSTGFLRFFEDFAYARFALGCRLERDVCEMSGLEAKEGGYVILRGSGLPHIDVMGFARQVSWSALVEQVAGVMAGEGPEIR